LDLSQCLHATLKGVVILYGQRKSFRNISVSLSEVRGRKCESVFTALWS